MYIDIYIRLYVCLKTTTAYLVYKCKHNNYINRKYYIEYLGLINSIISVSIIEALLINIFKNILFQN